MRDGSLSPDRFYLGPLPGTEQRLVAQLDAAATLELPEPPSLQEWLAEARVATLEGDARRALSTRIYWAFARVGFDDHEWLPDPELRAVCEAGGAAVNAYKTAVSNANFELLNLTSGPAHANKRAELGRQTEALQRGLAKLEARVRPYAAERDRRDGAR